MYSVRAGNGRIYPLERETIVDLLTNTLKKDCYVKKENRTVYRLWCPSCGLPVRISNVFSDNRPYASHWNDGSEESKDFDYRFKKCPLAKPTKFDIRARVSGQTPEIKEIYEIIYRYFDRMMAALSRTAGIYISIPFAQQLLEDALKNKQLYYFYQTKETLPWTFALGTTRYYLAGRRVRTDDAGKKFFEKIKKIFPEAQINTAERRKLELGRRDIQFCFNAHWTQIVANGIEEYIGMDIFDSQNHSLGVIPILVDRALFSNYLHKADWIDNVSLKKIAETHLSPPSGKEAPD